jgi:hypothetical protein
MAIYRPAKLPHIRCRHDHRSLRLQTEPPPRKKKPAVDFPCGRIVSARPPKRRPYAIIRDDGMPDEAQRTELITQFIERTLKINPCQSSPAASSNFARDSSSSAYSCSRRLASWGSMERAKRRACAASARSSAADRCSDGGTVAPAEFPDAQAPGLSQSVFGSGMFFTAGQFLSARAMFSAICCRHTSRQCIELLR